MEPGPVLLGIVLVAVGALAFRYGDTKLDVKEGALMRAMSKPQHFGKMVGVAFIGLGLWLAFKGLSA